MTQEPLDRAKNPTATRLWFTWETQRRNEELARAFACEYHRFEYSQHPAVLRYVFCLLQTLRVFTIHRPKVVFAQCPSIFLVSLVASLRMFQKFTFVIDAHNVMFDYLLSRNILVNNLIKFSLKKADLVMVSNSLLVPALGIFKEKAMVLPDKVPTITRHSPRPWFSQLKRPVITLISSFAPDEPIENFLLASQAFELPHVLLVTGQRKKAAALLKYESASLRFVDYLPKEDFEAILAGSDLLVDLTTRLDCLVCGAYEALAVGVPILLSDSAALREVFAEALFAKNDIQDYLRALREFFKEPIHFQSRIRALKDPFEKRWQEAFQKVQQRMEAMTPQ